MTDALNDQTLKRMAHTLSGIEHELMKIRDSVGRQVVTKVRTKPEGKGPFLAHQPEEVIDRLIATFRSAVEIHADRPSTDSARRVFETETELRKALRGQA